MVRESDEFGQLECVVDLKERSDEFGRFELGVHHLIPTGDGESGDEKILVGVDTTREECVAIVESWESDWGDSVEVVGSEYMDDFPHVLVYEFWPV
jgi:hypothetical protein